MKKSLEKIRKEDFSKCKKRQTIRCRKNGSINIFEYVKIIKDTEIK